MIRKEVTLTLFVMSLSEAEQVTKRSTSILSIKFLSKGIILVIIHQMFLLARDWSKLIMRPNMPRQTQRNILGYHPSDVPQFSNFKF